MLHFVAFYILLIVRILAALMEGLFEIQKYLLLHTKNIKYISVIMLCNDVEILKFNSKSLREEKCLSLIINIFS